MQHTCDLFERLNKSLDEIDLIEKIKAINQDVLGAYFFRVPEVHLYWMVIGIMAGILNVPVEALTIAVLIHELAHAYTHLGRDIDGNRWETESLAQTDLEIVEGLAQFYTVVVCNKLIARFPAAQQAFNALLTMQSGPYLVHKDWADESERGGEVIRFVMIATRSRKLLRYNQWQAELEQVRPQVGRKKRELPPSSTLQ